MHSRLQHNPAPLCDYPIFACFPASNLLQGSCHPHTPSSLFKCTFAHSANVQTHLHCALPMLAQCKPTCCCLLCRFRDFHVVAKPPHIRSYCGTPIVLANGYRVGVLCALDTKPHAMSASSTRLMVNVAGLIAREIEGLAGTDYDLPLQPKVCTTFATQDFALSRCALCW